MLDWVLNTPVDFLLQNYLIISLTEIFLQIAQNGSYYIDILEVTDRKQKLAVLLQLIGEKCQETLEPFLIHKRIEYNHKELITRVLLLRKMSTFVKSL